MKELIQKFIEKFAITASEDEDIATTELYMDNHDCIEYEEKTYYIPENNSFYTDDDELLRDFLVHSFGL